MVVWLPGGFQMPSHGDFWLNYARGEIGRLFGVKATVTSRYSNVRKFGRTLNADDGVKTTLMMLPGTEVNETFVSTNIIDEVVSDDAADIGTVTVQGLYYSANNDLVFHIQDVVLDGQTPAVLSQPLARITRIFVKTLVFASPASELVGNIFGYVSSDTVVTAGVPQTDSAVKIMIVAGDQQTEKAALSVDFRNFMLISNIAAEMTRTTGMPNNVDVELEFREQGGVFLPAGLELSFRDTGTTAAVLPVRPYIIIPPNSDVRMVATSNSNNAQVGGYFAGMIAGLDPQPDKPPAA